MALACTPRGAAWADLPAPASGTWPTKRCVWDDLPDGSLAAQLFDSVHPDRRRFLLRSPSMNRVVAG